MAQPKLTEIKLKSDKFYPLLDMIYPIGAIYWSKNNTSPASLFGGTWVQIVEDRFPLFGNDDTTGGSRTVSISVANLPSHSHSTGLGNTGGGRTDWGLVGEGAWGGACSFAKWNRKLYCNQRNRFWNSSYNSLAALEILLCLEKNRLKKVA